MKDNVSRCLLSWTICWRTASGREEVPGAGSGLEGRLACVWFPVSDVPPQPYSGLRVSPGTHPCPAARGGLG